MIKPGDIIKHKNFMDVAILVLLSHKNPETGEIEVKGCWVNQGQKESFTITTKRNPAGIPMEYVIKADQLKNWLVCSKPESNFIRAEKWKQLG